MTDERKIPEGWTLTGENVSRSFSFKSHLDAVKFVEAVSLEAISQDNYPEIKLAFEKVEISFPAGTETARFKCADLAKKIENFCDCYNLV